MKRYLNFIVESSRKPIMKYYAFDWDDNILMMPTVIHMEHLVDDEWVPEDVSTEKFSKVRNTDGWRSAPNAYLEFQDIGPRGTKAFMEDMLLALKNKDYGPSWDKFIHCLTSGSIFAIITARGHEPDTIRKSVEYIIKNILTVEERNEMCANLMAFQDMFVQNFDILRDISFSTLLSAYLDKCDFVGVSSPSFQEKYSGDAAKPEKAKTIALNEFVDRVNAYGQKIGGDVRLGFSDDDPGNVNKVREYFNEISNNYKDISFSVIDTSDPKIVGGIKKRI